MVIANSYLNSSADSGWTAAGISATYGMGTEWQLAASAGAYSADFHGATGNPYFIFSVLAATGIVLPRPLRTLMGVGR